MKIAIIGFGLEGQAAYEYWRDGNEITICDQHTEVKLPEGVESKLGDGYLSGLAEFDLIVRSPHVRPQAIIDANSAEIESKITSNTNEFFHVSPTKNIIGITGTKGKGTTSTLVAKMLEASGKSVHLGGNIGLPALELLKNDIKPDDWVVLELSSFQLIDLKSSPHVAVCLMVVPEHLDWHPDTEEYYAAKKQLFVHQSSEDIAIYFAENDVSQDIASSGSAQKIPYFAPPGATVVDGQIIIGDQTICATSEIKLLGTHNWQNSCAAVTAVWQITQDVDAIKSVLSTFSGLEHRLELVRELNGVRYYNDSFGTTPETAIVAIQAFDQPKILILGGSDKGANYDQLARTVTSGNVIKVLLIGQQADRIQSALETAGFHDFMPGGNNMTEIVGNAREQAVEGDVVILSTACASFDMFQNYKDRGEQFKSAVQALA